MVTEVLACSQAPQNHYYSVWSDMPNWRLNSASQFTNPEGEQGLRLDLDHVQNRLMATHLSIRVRTALAVVANGSAV
jgi:hypothetical protein